MGFLDSKFSTFMYILGTIALVSFGFWYGKYWSDSVAADKARESSPAVVAAAPVDNTQQSEPTHVAQGNVKCEADFTLSEAVLTGMAQIWRDDPGDYKHMYSGKTFLVNGTVACVIPRPEVPDETLIMVNVDGAPWSVTACIFDENIRYYSGLKPGDRMSVCGVYYAKSVPEDFEKQNDGKIYGPILWGCYLAERD